MRIMASLFIFLVVSALASPALAVKHRRPFNGSYRITAGYDNNGSAGGCTDYGCGSRCYNRHTGTDYGLPYNTPIRASAAGTVIARNDGCANVGSLGNTCGGRCGNYIFLRHDDGSETIYCHMKNGGLAVGQGQRVSCGQVIGYSASSGSSTGYHLHHGWKPSGSSREPYVGQCGKSGASAWVQQNGYSSLPSEQCEQTCECNPGQKQNRACGKCGSQSRTCGGSCKWGGWSSCGGQGTCAAGDTQRQDCCDCGERTRRCSSSCEWGDWSGCAGPDPSPSQTCETGKPGVCADGTMRCVEGCLACVEDTPAQDELCDDLDNDCDGEVDNGSPSEFGEARPEHAANIVDSSLPAALAPGERAMAWLRVENVGRARWEAGEVIVRAVADDPNAAAALGASSWLSYDVPARLERALEPGDVTTLAFEIVAAPSDFDGASVRFSLDVLGGGPMMCPRSGLEMEIATLRLIAAPPVADAPERAGAQGGDESIPPEDASDFEDTTHEEGGCASAPSPSVPAPGGMLLFGVFALAWRGARRMNLDSTEGR